MRCTELTVAETPAGKDRPRHPRQFRQPQAPQGAPSSIAIPASCSNTRQNRPLWLNAVEGFFSKLTRRRLKRDAFRSLVDLQAAISRRQ
jgi:hypothetical protein